MGPLAVTAALFLLGALLRDLPPRGNKTLCPAFTCLFLLGTALLCLPADLVGTTDLVHAVARVCAGVGYAGMCILWGSAICSLGIEQAEAVVLAASGVTTACALCLQLLEHTPVFAAVTVAVPAASGALLARVWSKGCAPTVAEARQADGHGGRRPRPQDGLPPIQMLAFIVAAYLVIGSGDTVQGAPSAGVNLSIDVPTVLGTGVGVMLAACVVFFSTRIDLTFLYRWMLPVLTAALALSPWDNALMQATGLALFWAADTCVQAIVFLCFIRLAKQGALPISLGIGIGQGCIQLGVLLGSALGPALQAAGLADAPACGVAMALTLVLVCVAAAMPRAYFGMRAPGRDSERPGATAPAAGGGHGASADGAALEQAARCYGLTERESQILGYLARGRSAPFIREELSLSKSTVATHVRHIYDKLGVHSKQELLSLLERRE